MRPRESGPRAQELTPALVAAAVPLAGAPSSTTPMQNFSRRAQAFLLWMASKSAVASSPATITMESAPPGCSLLYSVESYTFPFTTNHESCSVVCFATSDMGMRRSPPAAGAAAAGGAAAVESFSFEPNPNKPNPPPQNPIVE